MRTIDGEETITKALRNVPPARKPMNIGTSDSYAESVVVGGFPRDTEKQEMVGMITSNVIMGKGDYVEN